MEEASAAGDLQKVKEIFETLVISRQEGVSLEESTMPGSTSVLERSLYQAARNSHTAVLSYLLDQDVKVTDHVLRGAKESQSTSVFQTLLDHGWDINYTILGGITSLCFNLENKDIVKWHLENGADPNIITRRGFTALEFAAYKYPFDVVKLLVDHGADVRNTPAVHSAAAASSKWGDEAAHANLDRLKVMEFLLDRGANMDLVQSEFDAEGNPRHVDWSTGTALHCAVASEDPEHVRFLLRRGANRDIKGVMGLTPLEVAEKSNLPEIADILRNE